jgi:hypothetical protein
LQSALILEINCPEAIGSVVTNKIVIICLGLLFDTDVVTLPKVLSVLFSAEVAPTTSAFTCHQRQPSSEATNTAPQVNLVHAFTWEVSALLVDKIPTTSFAVGTFIYNLVSRKGSVLYPAGGHFGDGLGVTVTTFFTGAFFLTGAFFVTLAFGVGVGLLVAAFAGVTVSAKPRANAIANFLDLIISVDPT